MASVRVRTLEDIARISSERNNSTVLAAIAKENGEQVIRDFMSLSIVDYVRFLSLGDNNTMGANQISQTVELILEEPDFRGLTIEDYKLFFNQAKKGMFGPVYARMDGQAIITWLRQYVEERCLFFSMRSEREADTIRGGYTKGQGSEYVRKIAEGLANKNREKQNAK